jgi:hypothetical protein
MILNIPLPLLIWTDLQGNNDRQKAPTLSGQEDEPARCLACISVPPPNRLVLGRIATLCCASNDLLRRYAIYLCALLLRGPTLLLHV